MTESQYDQSGPRLGIVLGVVSVLAIVLGGLAYWRYVESENFFQRSLEEIDQKAFEGLQRGDERFEKTEGARRLSSRFDPTAQAVRQARCFGSDSAAWL